MHAGAIPLPLDDDPEALPVPELPEPPTPLLDPDDPKPPKSAEPSPPPGELGERPALPLEPQAESPAEIARPEMARRKRRRECIVCFGSCQPRVHMGRRFGSDK